ncbi:MAG TPA: response regulator [Aggregatilineales bacterium]|nr:response regulator [Aggregatilineales bacterium]
MAGALASYILNMYTINHGEIALMIRVLIVDDDDTLRLLIRLVLERMGCEVFDARNGVEAERQAAKTNPELVLLDIMMPVQGGYDTCSNLRRGGYSGTIIMCSSLQAEHEKDRADSVGANGFIQKPFTRESVRPILDSIHMQSVL